MPNPPSLPGKWPNVPLDQHLGYATHIRILCGAPLTGRRCGHMVTMLTSELYRMTPGAVTAADFQRRLRCARCSSKGWAIISVAGRG